MSKKYASKVKSEAGELTVEDLRDLHKKLGYLGFRGNDEAAKIKFFAAQKAIEDLIDWE